MRRHPKDLQAVYSLLVCIVIAWLVALGSTTHAAASKDQTRVHSVQTDMGPIMTLLLSHDRIRFTIQNIPGGVRTVTTSKDPGIAKTIRIHAREMEARVKQGNVIRPNDPLFAEIFRRHKEINVFLHDIPNGVAEAETSKNPQVVLLIRAHSQAVASFVRDGLPATRHNNPLPPEYHELTAGPVR